MFKKIFEYIFGKGIGIDDENPLLFHWVGKNYGDIECTVFIHNLRREGNFLYFEKGCRDWECDDNGCDCLACFFIKRGRWVGGVFDRGGKEYYRDLKNIVKLDNILPIKDGEECVYFEIKMDYSERTEVKRFRW